MLVNCNGLVIAILLWVMALPLDVRARIEVEDRRLKQTLYPRPAVTQTRTRRGLYASAETLGFSARCNAVRASTIATAAFEAGVFMRHPAGARLRARATGR
jgi:hypothetical protein